MGVQVRDPQAQCCGDAALNGVLHGGGDAGAPPDPQMDLSLLKNLVQDSSALKLLPYLSCSVRWSIVSNSLCILCIGGSIELRIVAVVPSQCVYISLYLIEDIGAQQVLGYTDVCSLNLLVGFCWAFCLF